MPKSISGIVYENRLSHSLDILSNGKIYSFNKSRLPKIKVEYSSVGKKTTGLQSSRKKAVRITGLPKGVAGKIFIVGAFVLDAIEELCPENLKYFQSPGKQIRGEDGKILYADGVIYKEHHELHNSGSK